MSPKSKIRTRSRFFSANSDKINDNQKFEESPYFCCPVKSKKKAKRKTKGFKGFTGNEQNESKEKEMLILIEANNQERKMRENQWLLGFKKEEVDGSKSKSVKVSTLMAKIKIDFLPLFLGFSKEEQLKSQENEEKLISNFLENKYWLRKIKSEDEARFEEEEGEKSNVVPSYSRIDSDSNKFDEEEAILSQIKKLTEKLRNVFETRGATANEIKSYRSPFFQIKVPPKSPHRLIEEDLYDDPWSLLVATIFLNKTSARSARPYVFWFLEENPDPRAVVAKSFRQLETYFGALGLQQTRAKQVWRMSYDFLYKEWTSVRELYGVGRYAEDAYRMFCLGDFSVEPTDRYLRIYKAWHQMQEKRARIKRN